MYQDIYWTPLDSVKVFTSSGHRASTDIDGSYHIPITGKTDSIWFYYNNKNTIKYPVDTIKNKQEFEVRILLPYPIFPKGYLPTVTVRARDYYEDSVELRSNYAKIFNWEKPGKALGKSVGVSPQGGIGVDFDQIINLFRFGYNKRQEVYQKFALQIEQDRYIDHRFTRKKIEDLTGLKDKDRDEYMKMYRPTYHELILLNEIELGKYIEITYKKYLEYKKRQKIERGIFTEP